MMTRAIPVLVWGALLVAGGLCAYLMSLVPLGVRGLLATLLLLAMALGPLLAHVVRQTVIYKTARLAHDKAPSHRRPPLCQAGERGGSALRVVHGREQGGGQRRL